jgi:tRNA threonylcarbamoyl adenosine modification protein (Sua5/YciO/YrdC/YwlC family)
VTARGALDALARGLIIGLPTDTVYGIAADPSIREAVESLFAAKGRPGVKPIPILAAGMDDVQRVALLDEDTAQLLAPYWPGGLTAVLPRAPGVPDWIGDPVLDTVGVRVPDHPAALAILEKAGPLAVTSANRSGQPPAVDAASARAALGDRVAVYVAGEGAGSEPSTVVDLVGDAPRVLRRGAVEWGGA